MKEIRSYEELRNGLADYADDGYREFAKKGIITERPILGVKIPLVREVVSRVPLSCYGEFLKMRPVAFEEVLARGMMICRLPYEEIVRVRDGGELWGDGVRRDDASESYFDSQIDCIDDWASCDTFCSGLSKVVRRHLVEFFDLEVDGLLDDPREFAVRVGLVMLKVAYVGPDWLAVIFDRVEKLASREEYYIRMAIAWLLAECFIKFSEAGLGYLRVSRLPAWTYNKTISKICDSYRVDEEMKEVVRKMRR